MSQHDVRPPPSCLQQTVPVNDSSLRSNQNHPLVCCTTLTMTNVKGTGMPQHPFYFHPFQIFHISRFINDQTSRSKDALDVPTSPLQVLHGRRFDHGETPKGEDTLNVQGWPLPDSSAVWVMTSTSGASPMTTEARMAPWRALSEHLQTFNWPRQIECPKAAAS